MKFLVKYVGDPEHSIEGYVENREQFLEWLRERNIERVRQQELSEYADDFELIPIQELTKESVTLPPSNLIQPIYWSYGDDKKLFFDTEEMEREFNIKIKELEEKFGGMQVE